MKSAEVHNLNSTILHTTTNVKATKLIGCVCREFSTGTEMVIFFFIFTLWL